MNCSLPPGDCAGSESRSSPGITWPRTRSGVTASCTMSIDTPSPSNVTRARRPSSRNSIRSPFAVAIVFPSIDGHGIVSR